MPNGGRFIFIADALNEWLLREGEQLYLALTLKSDRIQHELSSGLGVGFTLLPVE